VLGIDLTAATELSRQFDQNGIVWVKSDAVPTLKPTARAGGFDSSLPSPAFRQNG
jgi:hypothetical protein